MLIAFCALLLALPPSAYAETDTAQSIITATGYDVPTDDHLPEDYRFPEKYRENAVQFRTEDGVLLCGYVLGEGNRGITLGHPNGWMVKSWLPFAERLVDAGYLVILWEFRNIEPSGFAPESESRRWDLDVLAAAQVLRERGATRILAMGASDGGTATALAAPDIPELTGLGLLSSPKDSVGDAVQAIGRIKDVPAFFAVSSNDSYGDFHAHVKALYEACPSTHKQFIVIEGTDHGTDMITPEVPGMGYASFPRDDAQVRKRQELSDALLLFVDETFGSSAGWSDTSEATTPPSTGTSASSQTPDASNPGEPVLEEPGNLSQSDSGINVLFIVIGTVLVVLVAASITLLVILRQRKR
jgi:pimeloyl-ACP methyl ester carboxylesterase